MKHVNWKIRLKHSLKVISILLSFRIMLVVGYTQPTQNQVYRKIIEWGILCPDIVMQQAITETGCGKYGVGKSKNNIFGFRDRRGYITYSNWIESIADYKAWQDVRFPKHLEKHHSNGSICDYYHFLCYSGYRDGKACSQKGKDYIKYLKQIKVQLWEK